MCGEWAGCLTGEPHPDRSATTRAKTSRFNGLEESSKYVKVIKFAFFILTFDISYRNMRGQTQGTAG